MKRYVATTAALCAFLIFSGCASNKSPDTSSVESADTYESETQLEVKERPASGETGKTKTNKKSGFNLGSMFASKYSEYGEGSVYTPKAFGGRKQELATFYIYPKTDTAGFGSSYMAAYYYLTFDDSSRRMLTDSMNRYLKDFEEKKLDRNDKKSFKAYGKIPAIVRWGTIKSNNPYYNESAIITLGYKFEDNSPYFSMSMESVYDEGTAATASSSDDIINSMRLNYFLTKNQCKGFIENLSNEKVFEAYDVYSIETFGTPEADDVYIDSDDYDSDEDVE